MSFENQSDSTVIRQCRASARLLTVKVRANKSCPETDIFKDGVNLAKKTIVHMMGYRQRLLIFDASSFRADTGGAKAWTVAGQQLSYQKSNGPYASSH